MHKNDYMDLTILIPVKNEKDNIDSIINKIETSINIKYEILFINDFSNDETLELLKKKEITNNRIRVIDNKKKGLGETIRNGIKFSKGKFLTILMCDSSDDLNDLKKYYDTICNENLDAVFGSRFTNKSTIEGYPKVKLILNRFFNYFVSLLYLNKYNDFTNAFKIYRKDILKNLEPIVSESFNVFLEIPLKIINREYQYKIIPINWYGRKKGVSNFKINELRSKYIFTLIYCFSEKILLLKKGNNNN
tara:strand:+ start:1358 stop:2101 length:744 start_codon:yes stop_codon:yes gene_type:complete